MAQVVGDAPERSWPVVITVAARHPLRVEQPGALLVAGTVLLVRGQKTLRRARLGFDLRPGGAGLLLSGNF